MIGSELSNVGASHSADSRARRLVYLTRGARAFHVWLEGLIALVLVLDIIVVFGGVFSRYVLNSPLNWTDEVARLLLVTLTFVGSAVALYRGDHISVTAFRDRLPPSAAAFVRSVGLAAVLGFSLVVAIFAIGHMESRMGQVALAGGLPPVAFAIPAFVGSVLAVGYASVLLHRERRGFALAGSVALIGLVLIMAASRDIWQEPLLSIGTAGPVFVLLFGLVVAGVPITYSLGIAALTGLWLEGGVGLSALPARIEGGANQFVLLAVPFFVLAGGLMESGGISERLVAFVRVLVGHMRGGLGIVMIASMYLFSGVSGSKAADMAAVGSVLIPTMKRAKYDEGESVGILAASSVMGDTVPPSIARLVLASVSGLSVAALFVGGFIPAAVLAIALGITVYIRAGRLGGTPDPRPTRRQVGHALLGALLPFGMPFIIFFGILLGIATPTEVSSFAVLFGFFVGIAIYRELTVRRLGTVLVEAASVGGMIMLIASMGSALSWVLTLQRLPQEIAGLIASLDIGTIGFLLLTIVVMIIMGAVLEGLPALLVFAPILLPTAISVGVHPLHFGIVLMVAMSIGNFLPPVGAGVYVAAAIGKVRPERAMRPMFLYLGVLTLGLLVVAFVPAITLALPRWFLGID